MNYKTLFSYGIKSGDNAADIWWRRSHKLITYWCHCRENGLAFSAQRVSKIIQELELRIKECGALRHQLILQKEEDDRRLNMSYVELTCPSMRCNFTPGSYGIAVKFKDYVPGFLKCNKCGKPLETEEEKQLQHQLYDLGMFSN